MGASRSVGYVSQFDDEDDDVASQLRGLAVVLAHRKADDPDIVVDVGWPDAAARCPPGLFKILKAARVRAIDVVVVERVARFARDSDTAMRIAVILCDAGVEIREACRGQMRPDLPHVLSPPRSRMPRGRRGVREDRPGPDAV